MSVSISACKVDVAMDCRFRAADLFEYTGDQAEENTVLSAGIVRSSWDVPESAAQFVHDYFADIGASCCFLRIHCHQPRSVRLALEAVHRVQHCAAGGLLVTSFTAATGGYWIPADPVLRRLDGRGRVLCEESIPISSLDFSQDAVTVQVEAGLTGLLELVVWWFPQGAADALGELAEFSAAETQTFFQWGSHTRYVGPGGVYAHLVHGHVYENRFGWPHRRRICSENDAHSLYVTLSGLYRSTGKRIYDLLRRQIVMSVIDRQCNDGGWRHGEWTDGMESHYRLHCSGMHILMDALSEKDTPELRQHLARAADFVSTKTDPTAWGHWFLHDELETSSVAMEQAPFRWLRSRAYGKSASNMLVLNTHLDAWVAMDRYREITGDEQYRELVRSAMAAAEAVLSLRSADWLYRLLFLAINLTFLPAERASRLSLPLRAVKRLAWRYLVPRLPDIKARFPRLVMPGGYIDRELTLRTWAVDYHSINVMDLLRYVRRSGSPRALELARQAIEFAEERGLPDRWKELRGRAYALGFWAEALYHMCTLDSDRRYRVHLARTMQKLETQELGMAPSLLGANAEAVAPGRQIGCPSPEHMGLRIVNLSLAPAVELLVVNVTDQPLPLIWHPGAAAPSAWSLEFSDSAGEPLPQRDRPVVPPKDWILATAAGE